MFDILDANLAKKIHFQGVRAKKLDMFADVDIYSLPSPMRSYLELKQDFNSIHAPQTTINTSCPKGPLSCVNARSRQIHPERHSQETRKAENGRGMTPQAAPSHKTMAPAIRNGLSKDSTRTEQGGDKARSGPGYGLSRYANIYFQWTIYAYSQTPQSNSTLIAKRLTNNMENMAFFTTTLPPVRESC